MSPCRVLGPNPQVKSTRQTHGGGVHLGTFKCTVQNNIKRQTLRWGWQTAGLEQQPTVKQRTGSSANKDGSAKAHFWQPDYIFVHLRINYLCCCLRGKALICAFVWYLISRRKNAWQLPTGSMQKGTDVKIKAKAERVRWSILGARGWVARYLKDMSQHVFIYVARAAPQDAHLGVPVKLQGFTLSYDHHLCHPRNGKRRGEEGVEDSSPRSGHRVGDINREECALALTAFLKK